VYYYNIPSNVGVKADDIVSDECCESGFDEAYRDLEEPRRQRVNPCSENRERLKTSLIHII